jgi:glycine cleavage system H protein
MTTLTQVLEATAVFMLGLMARLALTLMIVVVLSVPILLALEAWKRFVALRRRALGIAEVGGLTWRAGLYYAPGHTWLERLRSGGVRLGADGLAQRLLTNVRHVVLPRVGTEVHRGQPLAEVTVGDRHVALVAPMDGAVVQVNEKVLREPQLLEEDPYGRGWLVTMKPAHEEVGRFFKGDAARDWFRSEGNRLSRFFEHDFGLAAADGGELMVPPQELLDEERWKRLTDEFLNKTE